MVESSAISTVAGRLLEEAGESLRWCKEHSGDRAAVVLLRRLEISIAAIALAFDYQMEGEPGRAAGALERADWTRRSQATNPFGFGSHT